jgi:hypothetical protein
MRKAKEASTLRSFFSGLWHLFDFVERSLGSERETSRMDDDMLRDLVISKANAAGLRSI